MSATINEPTLDENYQLAGVCDRCRTVRPLFPVHYERGYQRLCVRCWARNMKFITRDAEEVGRNITLQIAQADAANDQPRVDALLREKDRLNRGRGGR
ncbi:MAG: hypothetical protein ABIH23_05865 [bacterium]